MRAMIALALVGSVGISSARAMAPLSDAELLEQTQQRAFLFFVEKTDPNTGLTQDRADRDGTGHTVLASVASTGYALAALPVGVEHGWMTREAAQARALTALRFAKDRLANERGFFYHFVNLETGARMGKNELSSVDTGLFLCGALACGEYFGGEVRELANAIYDRVDWPWMMNNGGEKPNKLVLSLGWKPESGFSAYDYQNYCEAVLIYLLGLGSAIHPMPLASWDAFSRVEVKYGGLSTLRNVPIFVHQMPQGFFPMRDRRDHLGQDYWTASVNGTLIHRQYCIDQKNSGKRPHYGPDFWGLNASDSPDGYAVSRAPLGPDKGTLSPTGVLSSMPFTPDLSLHAAQAIYNTYGDRLWGKYGFGNAFNPDREWFDKSVIGIDLGMALLAIENHHSGLIWRLMGAHPATFRAYRTIGMLRPEEVAAGKLLEK